MGLFIILGLFLCSVPVQSADPDEEIRDGGQATQEDALDKGETKRPDDLEKTYPPLDQTTATEPKIFIESDDGLMTLNFINVEIREALSALAMEREINIAAAQEVTGNISVHLYRVSMSKALDAITLAGGLTYHKMGDLYYVYRPKQARDPHADDLVMRIIKLKYAEVAKVKEVLDGILDIRETKIHEPTMTLVVEDTPENIEKIESIVSSLDLLPKQVMIEVKILEVVLTDDMVFGVNWADILGDATIATGGFSTAVMPTTEPISPVASTGAGVFGNFIAAAGTAQQFTAALDALQIKTKINTLSTPKILAIHGKPARVQVGGQQGYRVTTTNVGVATESIEFIDTGTILEITPYIDDDGNILLNVKPSIASAEIKAGIPVTKTTTVTTWLMAKNGETVFIGGLIRDTKTKKREMIPCLGGIPGLGALFGRTTHNLDKSELIVLITPTILETPARTSNQKTIDKVRKVEKDFAKEPPPTLKQLFEFISPVK